MVVVPKYPAVPLVGSPAALRADPWCLRRSTWGDRRQNRAPHAPVSGFVRVVSVGV